MPPKSDPRPSGSKSHRFHPGSRAKIQARSLQRNPKRAKESLAMDGTIHRQLELAVDYLYSHGQIEMRSASKKLDHVDSKAPRLRVAQDVRVFKQGVSNFLRAIVRVAKLFRNARERARISGNDYLNALHTASVEFGESTLHATIAMHIDGLKKQQRSYFTNIMTPNQRRKSGSRFEKIAGSFSIPYLRKLEHMSGITNAKPEAHFALQTIAAAFLIEVIRRSAVYVAFLESHTLDDRVATQVLRDSGLATLPSVKVHRVNHRK